MTVDDYMEKYRKEQEESAKKGKEFLLGLLPALKGMGATKLVVHYEGSGDSGQIESITVLGPDGKEMSHAFEDSKIDDAACHVLSGLGIDWYNNDGAYGDVTLTVETGKITVENNQRFSDSELTEHEI